ncbi:MULTISPECIES: hypothetical protein [Paenibacillus]|uniref:Phage protein n=2 Tax=Paenibacillus TaxID=44249 RepID=A0ABX2ZFP8_PAEPO|nr:MULTISPECIES: hypothetical protein [Paenibacillus]MDR6779520.1 hypothetical protein [Paenibacillus peoriae]ODA09110.1 hypothetical protein A7312_27210 [Paenibacillus polymyxa]
MNITDVIKNKIDGLQEYVDEINNDIEDDFNPMNWSGGNFDDCYDMGLSHGRKFGRMMAYREILDLLEPENR